MGKAKHKIVNWKEYNKALVNRGSVTFWIDEEAISSWYSKAHHGGRGRGRTYSDHAIQTTLAIKGFFGLPLRDCEGDVLTRYLAMVLMTQSNAALWEDRAPRNKAVNHLKAGELKEWKEEAYYPGARCRKRTAINS